MNTAEERGDFRFKEENTEFQRSGVPGRSLGCSDRQRSSDSAPSGSRSCRCSSAASEGDRVKGIWCSHSPQPLPFHTPWCRDILRTWQGISSRLVEQVTRNNVLNEDQPERSTPGQDASPASKKASLEGAR